MELCHLPERILAQISIHLTIRDRLRLSVCSRKCLSSVQLKWAWSNVRQFKLNEDEFSVNHDREQYNLPAALFDSCLSFIRWLLPKCEHLTELHINLNQHSAAISEILNETSWVELKKLNLITMELFPDPECLKLIGQFVKSLRTNGETVAGNEIAFHLSLVPFYGANSSKTDFDWPNFCSSLTDNSRLSLTQFSLSSTYLACDVDNELLCQLIDKQPIDTVVLQLNDCPKADQLAKMCNSLKANCLKKLTINVLSEPVSFDFVGFIDSVDDQSLSCLHTLDIASIDSWPDFHTKIGVWLPKFFEKCPNLTNFLIGPDHPRSTKEEFREIIDLWEAKMTEKEETCAKMGTIPIKCESIQKLEEYLVALEYFPVIHEMNNCKDRSQHRVRVIGTERLCDFLVLIE